MKRKIPFFKQQNSYYCGPAIIQMVYSAYGVRITQKEAGRLAKSNSVRGTTVKDLVAVLKEPGFTVTAGENKTLATIKNALKKDAIVIVCYTEPVLEWGHYAIVEKISGGKITLIDPDSRTGTTSLLLEEFNKRWRDPLFTKTVRWAAIVEPEKLRKPRSKK
jgi:ABC-type bacteriocin/lantibiotic exporter with double-glycine peptidase domain